jgi:hypothetical protein
MREELARDILLQLIANTKPELELVDKAIELADKLIEGLASRDGLCNAPETETYIYVNNENGCLWYFYDVETEVKTPLQQDAVRGIIKNIRITNKEYKGIYSIKLDILVQSNQKSYWIRSGLNTNFAKSALLSMWQIQDFAEPHIVSIKPGKAHIAFCSMYNAMTKQRVEYKWQEIDPEQTARALQNRIIANIKNPVNLSTGELIESEAINLLIELTTKLIASKGISQESAREIVSARYNKKSRRLLSEAELKDFAEYLQNLEVSLANN